VLTPRPKAPELVDVTVLVKPIDPIIVVSDVESIGGSVGTTTWTNVVTPGPRPITDVIVAVDAARLPELIVIVLSTVGTPMSTNVVVEAPMPKRPKSVDVTVLVKPTAPMKVVVAVASTDGSPGAGVGRPTSTNIVIPSPMPRSDVTVLVYGARLPETLVTVLSTVGTPTNT
jgi:hypothetical protein